MLSCSKGQGTLVSFSLLPVIHEQWASSHAKFSGQFKGFQKLSIHRTTLLSQQHVMMSKCHMTCNNYLASWYNLSQNRLKSNRFYTNINQNAALDQLLFMTFLSCIFHSVIVLCTTLFLIHLLSFSHPHLKIKNKHLLLIKKMTHKKKINIEEM